MPTPFPSERTRRAAGQALRIGLGAAVVLIGLAAALPGATGQSLPAAPAPVPGSLLDRDKPAPSKPQQAAPKEEQKAPPAPRPQQAAPAARPPAKTPEGAKPAAKAAEETKPPAKGEEEGKPPARAKGGKRPPGQVPGPILAKLEPLTLKVPAEYRDPKAAKRPNTEVLLSAVGSDLAPRFTKGGRCATPGAKCPDFTNLIVFRSHDGVAATVAKRYKAPPETLRTFASAHGLSQIPPRAARGHNTRHFLAAVDGRPVWVVCERYDLAKKPRPEARYCDLTFDAGEGLGARLVFHEARLDEWRKMHAAASALVGRLRG